MGIVPVKSLQSTIRKSPGKQIKLPLFSGNPSTDDYVHLNKGLVHREINQGFIAQSIRKGKGFALLNGVSEEEANRPQRTKYTLWAICGVLKESV